MSSTTSSVPHRALTPLLLFSAILLAFTSYIYRENLLSFGSYVSQGDVVDTGYAKYLGNRSYPNTVAYLGIPYAEPPVGNRRFRAPLPLNRTRIAEETRGTVVNATQYPNFCIQTSTGGRDGVAGSEDCLNVNIYAPVGAKRGSNLPVLFYIHGGGYTYGNPKNWHFDHWIHQSPNVVIVSVYYRLSSFGFLATPSLRDPTNGDLNVGFLDQIQALKWVNENIVSFGGNPNQVTINGESAGGSSVEFHLVAHESQKLFNGAIAQSVYRTPVPTPEEQELLFAFYANHAGCGDGSDVDKIACLREASVSALAMAQGAAVTSAFTTSGYNTFHPVIDGKVINEYPTKAILAGKFARVPLIVGATTNEALPGGTNVYTALKAFFPSILDEDINALLGVYPLSDFGTEDLQFQTITGDSVNRCARSIMATEFGKSGNSWAYRYNQAVPGDAAVFHAAENWMMFEGTSIGSNGTRTFNSMTPTEIAFAEELIAYWLSFVRSGDPNTFKLERSPVWTRFSEENSRIVLQENSTAVSGSFMESESAEETSRCWLVASQVMSQQN